MQIAGVQDETVRARPDCQTGLYGKQPVEERAIPPERHAEVLSRYVLSISARPFPLQGFSLGGKNFGEAFHNRCNQLVCFLHRSPRFVHESGLDHIPSRSMILELIFLEER